MALAKTIKQDLITCPVCLEVYTDPRQLACHHSFCLTCLHAVHCQAGGTGVIRCPMCREDTRLPINGLDHLKADFTIKSLIDLLHANNVSQSERHSTEACSRCGHISRSRRTEGDGLSCCSKSSHLTGRTKTNGHRLSYAEGDKPRRKLNSAKYSTVSDTLQGRRMCSKHSTEKIKYHCQQCDSRVCATCVISEHKSHTITQV